MEPILIESDVCFNGYLYDKYEYPDIDVLTGSQFNSLKGLKNNRGTAELNPIEDADGDLILGLQVADDPDWKDIGVIKNASTKKYRKLVPKIDPNTGDVMTCSTGSGSSSTQKK